MLAIYFKWMTWLYISFFCFNTILSSFDDEIACLSWVHQLALPCEPTLRLPYHTVHTQPVHYQQSILLNSFCLPIQTALSNCCDSRGIQNSYYRLPQCSFVKAILRQLLFVLFFPHATLSNAPMTYKLIWFTFIKGMRANGLHPKFCSYRKSLILNDGHSLIHL